MTKKEKRNLPIGIWILTIFYSLAFLLYIAGAIVAFFFPDLLLNVPGFDELSKKIGRSVFSNFGIVLLVFAIVSIVVSIGLFMKKNFARYIAVIISIIMVIGGVMSLLERWYAGIVNLVLNLLIVIYLLFSKKVKTSFAKNNNKHHNHLNHSITPEIK